MSDRLALCVCTARCTEGDCVMDTVSCTERECVVGAVIGHVVCSLSRTVGWFSDLLFGNQYVLFVMYLHKEGFPTVHFLYL